MKPARHNLEAQQEEQQAKLDAIKRHLLARFGPELLGADADTFTQDCLDAVKLVETGQATTPDRVLVAHLDLAQFCW